MYCEYIFLGNDFTVIIITLRRLCVPLKWDPAFFIIISHVPSVEENSKC